MEWIDTLLGVLGGGALVTIITMPSIIKKAKAEAKASELDNMQKVADGWKALADERQEANVDRDAHIKDLNERIDSLYVINGQWRDKYNTLQEENANLRVKIATDEVKLCVVRGCQNREPQSGY